MRSLLLLLLLASWYALPAFSLPTRLPGSSFGVPGNASFDYVVLGGGTAGLAIATTLAGDPSLSVAVIEAGAFYEVDNGNISVMPGDCTFYSGTAPSNTQPLVDWGFDTVPQAVGFIPLSRTSMPGLMIANWKGANNRIMHYARGKTLGGSSARNYMVNHRQVKSCCPLLFPPILSLTHQDQR